MKGARPLTNGEIELCVNTLLTARDKALFILGVKSGFRISELLSLTVGDVYRNNVIQDTVSVRRCNMKKKTAGRTVVLHPEAKKYLNLLLSGSKMSPDVPLFQSRNGGAISRIQAWRVLNDAYTTLGMQGKLGTHAMRKSFADRVYEALDRDLIRTQKALGHTNINSTVSYLGFKEEDINVAILSI